MIVYTPQTPPLPQEEEDIAVVFLQTMGLKVASEVRDAPINLSYLEAKHYSQIFKTFDKDRDGHISIHDLRKALKEMGEKVDEDELRGLIAEVDINQNATIEEEEFLQVGVAKRNSFHVGWALIRMLPLRRSFCRWVWWLTGTQKLMLGLGQFLCGVGINMKTITCWWVGLL